jgi:hypothetical protein
MSARTLELNCLVLGNDPSIFTVEIASSKTVSILKDMIKEKKQNEFKDVDADTLILWKVSIPDNDNLKQHLNTLELNESSELLRRSTSRLLNVFKGELEEEHVHIVVQPPPTGGFIAPIFCDFLANQ